MKSKTSFRITSLLLVITLVFSVNAFAVGGEQDISLPAAKADLQIDTDFNLYDDGNTSDITLSGAQGGVMPFAFAQSPTYTGTMSTAGEMRYFYPVWVNPGEIFQVTMVSPINANLDYDLYLFEFDLNTGDLNGSPLVSSTYWTYLNTYTVNGVSVTKTLDETVALVNNTASARAFAIGVHCAVGGTTGTFSMTYSIGDTYDQLESGLNGNAAQAIGFGTQDDTSRFVNVLTLSTPDDNDWLEFTVPSNRNYKGLSLQLDEASLARGYRAEVYYNAQSRMIYCGSSDAPTPLTVDGDYYLRIFTTGTVSDTATYEIGFAPVLFTADATSIQILGTQMGSWNYGFEPPFNGQVWRVSGNEWIRGRVAGAGGLPVVNASVTLVWESWYYPDWNPVWTKTVTVTTDANGEFVAQLGLPAALGRDSKLIGVVPPYFNHVMDKSDLYLFANNGDIQTYVPLIHFGYSYAS